MIQWIKEKARRSWICDSCLVLINKGDIYWKRSEHDVIGLLIWRRHDECRMKPL